MCACAIKPEVGLSSGGKFGNDNFVQNLVLTTESATMPWDDIEVGIGGDETANFGQRNESGPGLYQVDTLATVSNSGQVSKNPRLYAASSQLGLCLVADCQVSLFTETCDDHLITLTYGSPVDAVVCSKDSLFLLIGESSGTLHMMETSTQTMLFSESLVPDLQPVNGKAFHGIEITLSVEDGSYDLTILTSDDRLVRFSQIDLKGLSKALETKDFPTAKKLKDSIQMEMVDTSSDHTEEAICLKCHSWGADTVVITGGKGESSLCVWSKGEEDATELLTGIDSRLLGGSSVVKCDFKDNFLFVLTKKGVLSQWDAQSLVKLNKWRGIAVQDFLLLDASSVHSPTKNANLQSSLKIVLLTLPKEKGKCHLQVHSLPGMQLAYSLELNQVSALVCAPASQETIFVIEGAHKDDVEDTSSSDAVVSTLRVRCLTEALPDTRFHRLLHKKQYEEALKFAQSYELDVELVYKVKAQDILTQTDPWTRTQEDGQTTDQIFADLKDCLSHISDNGCVADICVQATLPTMQSTYELLTYAEGRVNKKGGDSVLSEEELISRAAWQTKVLEALHRLGTFQVVFGPQLFSATQWYEFMKADLLVEVCEGFRRTDVQQAAAIWCRHQAEFEARFTVEWLKRVLQSITDNVLSDLILPWLRGDFVPFVLRVLPEGRAVLAQWLEQRARNLELSEKASWPENGLAIAELMVKVGGRRAEWENGKMLLTPAQLVTQYEHGISEAESSLNTLIQHLQHLLILHNKCNFKISLSEYCQETTTSITFRMLDRVVAPELIPATIDKMVRPYMKDHGLEEDKVLLEYIQDLLEQCSGRASYQLEASWEVKAMTCVHCMKDMECKYEGTLLLMNKAVIPWSQAMETFVAEALKWKHPRAAELQHRYSMINLRKMLANYALRNYNVSEFTTAPSLLKYILYQDQPTVMQDALQVVEAYPDHLKKTDAYNIRTHFFIQKNRLSECMALLKSLPKEETEVCVRKIVIWAELTLQDTIIAEEEVHKKKQMIAVEAALLALKHLADIEEDMFNLLEYEEKVQDFENIFALQKEYGEFLTRSEYQDAEFRKAVLMEHLAKFFQSMAQTDDMEDGDASADPCHDDDRKRRPMKGNYSKMFRLAQLLGVSSDELRGHLAVRASQDGNIDSAVNMCQILYEQAPNATTGRVLYNVAHNLCSMQADPEAPMAAQQRSNIANIIHQLASQALTICEQDLICDCLELSKCSSLSQRVYQKCEKAAYDVTVQPADDDDHLAGPQKDPYSEWTYDSFFKEDGLVLDTAEAMPLTYQFTLACLPQAGCSVKGSIVPLNHARVAGRSSPEDDEGSEHILDEIHASTSNIVQYLQESSLYQLAFQFSIQALGVCLQHVLMDEILTLQKEADSEQQGLKAMKREKLVAMGKQGSVLGSEFITALLTKLFSCRRVDHNLALGYVSALNKADGFKKLKSQSSSAGLNYRRVLAIANVGKDLARLINQGDVLKACESLAADARWGHRLQKMKISFKDAFQKEPAAKQKLLPTIIANEQTDLDLILDYCRTFRLNPSDALLLYLEYLLLLQPTLDPAGTSTLDEHIKHAAQCVSKVQPIIEQIHVKEMLLKRMANLLVTKINFYDYERIRFILSVMEVNMEREKIAFVWTIDLAKGLELLEFLWHYRRTQEPDQYELSFKPCADAGDEEERKLFTEFATAPLLSKKRLPFHPLLLGNSWKIIRPELSVETVSALLPVTKLLKMPTDQVYVSAIQNMVNSCVKDQPRDVIPAPDEHSSMELRKLPGLDRKLVESIRCLLLQVEDIQLAVATSRWVAKELPLGAEQVMVLKACAFLTKKWQESLPENSPDREKASIMLNRVTAATQQVSTQHVLFKYRLAKPPHLSLASSPAKLIFMLYEDESIEKRLVEKAGVFPDIHAAAEEISQIGSKDLGKIRVTLFEQWLYASGGSKQGEEQDSTETLNFQEPENQEAKEEERSLHRMVYLMQFQAMEKSATFLLNIAYASGSKVTYVSRVRALRCLLSLVDNQVVEAVAKKPVEEVREYMKCLLYLAELEALHVPQTLESFNKSNKAALARGLWRNHNHEWRAVRLVSDLCLDYEIWDPHMWNSILQQLLAFRMLKYLEHVLVRLSAISDLWQVGCLMRAWKTVLLSPFTTACEDQKAACLKVYTLIQRCPLLLELDVVGFSRQFLQAGLPACALGCLLFLPDDQKRNKHIQTLLASGCSVGILDQMRELDLARTPLSQGAQIVGEVHQYLDITHQYDVVLGTPHFSSLQAYLVRQDRTSSLAQWLLDNDRLTEAIQLAQQYHQVHGDGSITAKPQIGLQQLQAFLKSQGLSSCEEMLSFEEN
ncbi:KNTC1 [Branchiostoma lanceolatum]|uniref:KNTC1 protein n=1 Tax=Branchiostoma lanceolatum TaxID=7740 RepID=A0A8K0ES36_BRALA|nr:KNTC1 [Branchiostoma lanceolatum]